MADNKRISDQLLAAYLDGNVTKSEMLQVLEALKNDEKLRETVEIAMSIDNDNAVAFDVLPMKEMAAENNENVCSVLCEAFILHRRGVAFDEKQLMALARNNGWLKPQGTPLHQIGQLLVHNNLMVTRRYNTDIDAVQKVLLADNDVIAAVDSDKLYPGRKDIEDAPNHAVVVLGVSDDKVTLFDPSADETTVTVLKKDFLRAWAESQNYIVRVLQSADDYEPSPIKLDDVELTDDLLELQEAIAENAHEVWADARKREGWTYGKTRDDAARKHPDLIPYSALTEAEKEYDRIMALNTIRLVRKLGYVIKKK